MDTIKAGKPVVNFLKLCYGAKRSGLLVGKHGIGKSELLMQAADELGIGCIVRDLSLMEPPDLIGLPYAKGDCTHYSPPGFLPREGEGLIVFEELNRCEKFMQAPCLQLLTNRTLNDYRLPSGWLAFAAINPDDSDYTVSPLDPALLSRFVQVQVVPDAKEWVAWARQNGIHDRVIHYVRSDPSIFEDPDSNPRAWAYVSNLLDAADEAWNSPTLRAAVLGTVGDVRGAAFLQTLKLGERPLTLDEILGDDEKPIENLKQWIKSRRIDLVEMSLQGVLKALQPRADFDALRDDPAAWAKLSDFFANLPGDQLEAARDFFRDRDYSFPSQKPKRIKK